MTPSPSGRETPSARSHAGPVALLVAERPDALASKAFMQLRRELMADLAASYRTELLPLVAAQRG